MHSLSPPPPSRSHSSAGAPLPTNGVLYVPHLPHHHLYPLPHPHAPHDERERINSPHHQSLPLPPSSISSRDRERNKSPPSPSTSPRRHSSHREMPPSSSTVHSLPHKYITPQVPFYVQAAHYRPVHPGYPIRPSTVKRDGVPLDDNKASPPGLISVSGPEDIHPPSLLVESHPGSHLAAQQQQQQQQDGGSYHPVRRRGEAAAMVDIGHGNLEAYSFSLRILLIKIFFKSCCFLFQCFFK